MRDRRTSGRRTAVRSGGIATATIQHLYELIARRPVDVVAIVGAAAAGIVIIVNAVFLQSYARPAPFFAAPNQSPSGENHAAVSVSTLKPAEAAAPWPMAPQRPVQAVSVRHSDPIADLIGGLAGPSSTRVIAVQRVLSAFGYGQLRSSGIVDAPTRSAIEKFESEHKMPVTGRVSDRLLTELAAMVGHSIE